MSGTSTTSRVLRMLREATESVLANLFGLWLALTGILAIAMGIRFVAEWLATHVGPGVALVFVIVCSLLWLTFITRISPESLRNPQRKIMPGAALGFIFAVAMVWV